MLADAALFSAFSPGERALLARRLIERVVKQGSTIVHQNEPANSLFFVREEVLEVRLTGSAGVEVAVNRLVAGDVFGEISLLTGEPRGASVVSLTDAVLYELRKEDIAPLLEQRPELSGALADLMAARQRWGLARMHALEAAHRAETFSSPVGILGRMRDFFAVSGGR